MLKKHFNQVSSLFDIQTSASNMRDVLPPANYCARESQTVSTELSVIYLIDIDLVVYS